MLCLVHQDTLLMYLLDSKEFSAFCTSCYLDFGSKQVFVVGMLTIDKTHYVYVYDAHYLN